MKLEGFPEHGKTEDKIRFLVRFGMKQAEIARLLGVSRQRVNTVARRHGITPSQDEIRRERQDQIRLLHRHGIQPAQIARTVAYPSSTVWADMRRVLEPATAT